MYRLEIAGDRPLMPGTGAGWLSHEGVEVAERVPELGARNPGRDRLVESGRLAELPAGTEQLGRVRMDQPVAREGSVGHAVVP